MASVHAHSPAQLCHLSGKNSVYMLPTIVEVEMPAKYCIIQWIELKNEICVELNLD